SAGIGAFQGESDANGRARKSNWAPPCESRSATCEPDPPASESDDPLAPLDGTVALLPDGLTDVPIRSNEEPGRETPGSLPATGAVESLAPTVPPPPPPPQATRAAQAIVTNDSERDLLNRSLALRGASARNASGTHFVTALVANLVSSEAEEVAHLAGRHVYVVTLFTAD